MKQLSKSELDNLGKEIIEKYIDFINIDYSYPMYKEASRKKHFDNYYKEYQLKIGLNEQDENAKKNIEYSKKYLDAIVNLDGLDRILDVSYRAFKDENITLIRIFNMINYSEQKIEDAIEYNKLLEAIPTEARAKISKTLAKEKDVEKLKQDLVSFEFILQDTFQNNLKAKLENLTYQFARIVFCILCIDTILKVFGIKQSYLVEQPFLDEDYLDAIKTIRECFKYSKRIKDFNKTELYLKYDKYIHLTNVLKTKEYTEAENKVIASIKKLVLEEPSQPRVEKMLELCNDKLFKQGWWYYDKEK